MVKRKIKFPRFVNAYTNLNGILISSTGNSNSQRWQIYKPHLNNNKNLKLLLGQKTLQLPNALSLYKKKKLSHLEFIRFVKMMFCFLEIIPVIGMWNIHQRLRATSGN